MNPDDPSQLSLLETSEPADDPKRKRRSGRSTERDKASRDEKPAPIRCKHCRYPMTDAGRRHACGLGIDVRTLVGGDDFGWRAREPCHTTALSKDQVPCDRYEEGSAEDGNA